MTTQLTDLAQRLPQYQHNIRQKLESARTTGGGMITRMSRFVRDVSEELIPAPPASPKPQPGEEKPVPVEIRRTSLPPFQFLGSVLGSVVNVVLMAAIVVVFVIFILIQREDLRDRLIRVVGASQLHLTTQALDDAAGRVSRYLQAQLIINVVFGVAVGIGLYFMRVPNPALWGMVATLLRYIPYLGIWIAAAMPAAITFAVEPGWVRPILVFSLYLGSDLLIYNFVEPLMYGNSTGISPIGIVVSAVFWAWLWGPVGLLLATPLSVCVVVIGRYVPKLEFLSVVLTDEPVLPPATRYYQRMLANDEQEAREIAEKFMKGRSLEQLYDEVLIPALTLAEEDRHSGKLDRSHEQFLLQHTRAVVEEFAQREEELVARNGRKKSGEPPQTKPKPIVATEPGEVTVVSIAARDEADEIAALMLHQLLTKRGIVSRTVGSGALASECVEEVGREKIKVACVSAIPPRGYIHTRYLCKRLHTEFPDLKLIAAILNEGDPQRVRDRKPEIPADQVTTTLKQTVSDVLSLATTENHQTGQKAFSS
jgi:predicted PurR-regulated permease PerM